MDRGAEVPLPAATYDMACLEYLAGGRNRDFPGRLGQSNTFSYASRFKPLERQWRKAGSPDERERILSEARVKAMKIIRRDFPQMRGFEPQPEQSLRREPVPEIPRFRHGL